MDAQQVLVIEDDAATAAFLADNLRADGYAVVVVDAVGPALRALEIRPIDVVLLDVGLGEANGLAVLDVVRAADGVAARIDRDLPVIVLSGRGSEVERLRGFRRGADDYVVKPFSYPELLARMQAVLRRAAARPLLRGVIQVADLEIDPVARTVRLGGEAVYLSMREFDLLHALAKQPTRVYTKGELLRDVWGYPTAGASRTVDTHACRLRNKLTRGGRPFVETVRGVGYRLLAGAA
jgi:DNA-binding response OmpR family regulator